MRAYGNRDEWPEGADASALNNGHNIGLALRWYAALAEMDALFALPDPVIRGRLTRFMTEAVAMVKARPALTMLPMGTPLMTGAGMRCRPSCPFLLKIRMRPAVRWRWKMRGGCIAG